MTIHTNPVPATYRPLHPLERKNFYVGAWESQSCRSCHAWLPSMDLRLKATVRNYEEHGSTWWAVKNLNSR